MSDLVMALGGAALIAAVFVDALSTTVLVSEGAGWLTRRVVGLVWRGLLRLHRRDRPSRSLTVAGPLLLIATVLLWVVGLWAGWCLLFLSGEGTVVDSRTQATAGGGDVVYFVGFTVFTLGTGDFIAATTSWRLLSVTASFTGLFLVTLAITYLISVVSAVVARRSLAISVNAMGTSGTDIVLRAWDRDTFSATFTQQLTAMTDKLATSAQQHLAYPVLHYFRSQHKSASAPIAVAQLEDATLLLLAGVAPSARPDDAAVRALRYVLDRYVDTATSTSALPRSEDPPPVPSISELAEAGIPVADEASFVAVVGSQEGYRRELCRIVHGDGWSWPTRLHT